MTNMTNNKIHETAIISSDAQIGNNVEIGPYTVVENDVIIKDNCKIGSYVTLAEGVRLDENVKVFNGAVLGTVPQDLKFGGEKTLLEIGEGTVIREFATLNRGTKDRGKSKVGKNCLIMAYAHIAHDCFIGDNCILVNGASLAGHIDVGNHVILSGSVLVHQFGKIGNYTMVEGGCKVKKDLPPYLLVMGEPARFSGLNKIGLSRKGFSKETIQKISDAYRIVYRDGLLLEEAILQLEKDYSDVKEVMEIVTFLKSSKRGIVRPKK